MIKIAALLAAAVFLASPNTPSVSIHNSPGGLIDTFLWNRYSFEQSGLEIRISGGCASACTIYTGSRNTCVEPGGFFWFRRGNKWRATYMMAKTMEPELAAFQAQYELPTFESGDYLCLPMADAIAAGWMRECS